MTDTYNGKHLEPGHPGPEQPTAPVPAAAPVAAPQAAAATPAARGPERIECPECGETKDVLMGSREAAGFCDKCDYPLFWSRQQITLGDGDRTDDTVTRRSAGTGGRITLASVPCPHCREPNAQSAITCSRCHLPMVVVAKVEPVIAPPAPPAPVVVPERRTPWWVWVVSLLTLFLIVALVAYALQQR